MSFLNFFRHKNKALRLSSLPCCSTAIFILKSMIVVDILSGFLASLVSKSTKFNYSEGGHQSCTELKAWKRAKPLTH